MNEHTTTEKEQRRHNRRLAKVAVQYSADSLVLRNRQLLVAANRQTV